MNELTSALMNVRKVILAVYSKVVSSRLGRSLETFYTVKVISAFLVSHFRSTFVEVQGHKMFLDPKDSLGLSIHGAYEPFATSLVKKVVKEGDVVLDIGANIGYYTLILAKLVGQRGKVFAFEPGPLNFALLKKNIEINGYKNVILEQKAVSDRSEMTRLYLSADNPADHRIYDSHDNRRFIQISAVRLDDYFKDYFGKIDFIKMDIQGAEGLAIKGMANLLRRNANVKVLTEFWPFGLTRCGLEPNEYLSMLLSLRFKLYEVSEQERKIKPVVVSRLLHMYTPDKRNYTNLLCVR